MKGVWALSSHCLQLERSHALEHDVVDVYGLSRIVSSGPGPKLESDIRVRMSKSAPTKSVNHVGMLGFVCVMHVALWQSQICAILAGSVRSRLTSNGCHHDGCYNL